MHWSSKIGQDRSENVKMYVEFTQAQTRGVARGARPVLFVLYKLVKPFYGKPSGLQFYTWNSKLGWVWNSTHVETHHDKESYCLGLFAVAFRLIFWAVQVTKVENHPCDEWLTLETSTFNLFTVAQFTLSTQLINTKFCVSLPHRCSTTVSLETN